MPRLLRVVLLTAALSTTSVVLAQTTPPQPSQPGKMPSPSTAPPEKAAPPGTNASPGSTSSPQWHSHQSGELRASKLIGTSVKNAAGETIGEINEVVLGSDGRVAAVVIGVGGFLGIGEHQVAVEFDSLHLSYGADQPATATLNATKQSLKAAPEWKWSTEDSGSPTGMGTKPVK